MTTNTHTISAFKFFEMFPDECSSRVYFEKKMWNGKLVCPYCNHKHITTLKKEGYYRCKSCTKDFTVRVGTIMQKSKIPLRKWLYTMYLVVTARKGISSLQLSKELGITQKSAWFLLQRIREACKSDTGMLSGIVEIDETYIGGLEKNKHADKQTPNNQGRSTKTKTAVVGMKQRNGKVIARSFGSVNSNNIQQYIDGNVAKGSTLSTDEARFYRPIKGYAKLMVNHSVSEWVNGMASTNGIESVWAVLKRGYHDTFHHFSKKHIDRYINEFTFRLNEGNCKVDLMDRMQAMVTGATGKRLTYKELIND